MGHDRLRPPSDGVGILRVAPLALLVALTAGCAVDLREHRNVLNWLDGELTPASTTARVALVPVALPVGVAGYLVDSFLVNPVRVADDAWFDTVDLLWTSRGESTFRRMLLVPFAAIATPFVLVGDWLGRFLLPIPSRKPDADDEQET